jgi:uncharacterized membrane protein (UPF0127 family)
MNKKPIEYPKSKSLWDNYQIITKTIQGKKLRLVVADTAERREKGLMYVRKPVQNFDGMIFLFEDKQIRTFWNMNTFENLTLYWMDDETIVGTSELPSLEKSIEIVRVSSPESANIVVEVIQ